MPSLYESTVNTGEVSSSNFTTLYNASGLQVPNAGAGSVTGNLNVGGNLTVQGNSLLIGEVTLQSTLSLPNYTFPLPDGSTDQVLVTDGNGNLYWTDVSAIPGADYNISATTVSGGANLTLANTAGFTDNVKFASGTNIIVSRTDANTITISTIADDIPNGTARGQVLYWNGSAWTASSNIASSVAGDRLVATYENSDPGQKAALFLRKDYGATNYTPVNNDGVGINFGVESDSQGISSYGSVAFEYSPTDPQFFVTSSTDNFVSQNTTLLALQKSTANLFAPNITLNAYQTGTPALNASIIAERGSSTNATLTWNESTDRWEFTNDLLVAGDLAVNGGDITTTSAQGNIFNATATDINIGNSAAFVRLGAGGVTNTNTVVIKPGILVGEATTQAVFNTVATTVNAFGAATTTNIGSTVSGTTNIGFNLNVKNSANVENTLTVPNITTLTGDDLNISAFNARNINITATNAADNGGITLTTNTSVDPVTIVRNSATTNTPTRTLTLRADSTSTPVVGYGNSLTFETESTPGAFVESGYISTVSTADTAGVLDTFRMSFGLLDANTSQIRMSLDSLGNLQIDNNLQIDGDTLQINAVGPAADGFIYFNGTAESLKWNQADTRFEFSDQLYISQTGDPAVFERRATTAQTSVESIPALVLLERVTDAGSNATDDAGPGIMFGRTSGASGGAQVNFAEIGANYFGTTNTAEYRFFWSDDNFTETSPGVYPGTYTLLRLGSDNAEFFNNSVYIDYSTAGAAQVGINTNTPTNALSVVGDADVSGSVSASEFTADGAATFNTQTTTTTSTAITSISISTRTTQKVIITITDNVTTEMHVLEALAFQKGTTAYLTTYGEMYSNAALATFTADVSGGFIRIRATPASANSTTFTVARISVD